MTREDCWNTYSRNLMNAFAAFGLDEVEILADIADNTELNETIRKLFRDSAIECGDFFQTTLRDFMELEWDEEDIDFIVLTFILEHIMEKAKLKEKFDEIMVAKLEAGESPNVDDMISELILQLYGEHIAKISEIGAAWTECIIGEIDLTGDDAFEDKFRSDWE